MQKQVYGTNGLDALWYGPSWKWSNDTLPPLKDRYQSFIYGSGNPFDLQDPKVIERNVEYDVESGLYVITETIDGSMYRAPMYMTLEEYLEWRSKEEDSDYMKELSNLNKSGAVTDDPVSAYQDRISSSLVERLFCGSTIDQV